MSRYYLLIRHQKLWRDTSGADRRTSFIIIAMSLHNNECPVKIISEPSHQYTTCLKQWYESSWVKNNPRTPPHDTGDHLSCLDALNGPRTLRRDQHRSPKGSKALTSQLCTHEFTILNQSTDSTRRHVMYWLDVAAT